MAMTMDDEKPKVTRAQSPERAAFSALAAAKKKRDAVKGRIDRLEKDLAEVREKLPEAEREVEEKREAFQRFVGE